MTSAEQLALRLPDKQWASFRCRLTTKSMDTAEIPTSPWIMEVFTPPIIQMLNRNGVPSVRRRSGTCLMIPFVLFQPNMSDTMQMDPVGTRILCKFSIFIQKDLIVTFILYIVAQTADFILNRLWQRIRRPMLTSLDSTTKLRSTRKTIWGPRAAYLGRVNRTCRTHSSPRRRHPRICLGSPSIMTTWIEHLRPWLRKD